MEFNLALYLQGLFFSFMATVIFGALDWIIIGKNKRLYVLPIVSILLWTIMYVSGGLILFLITLFGVLTSGVGFFIGFWISGYILLKVIVYIVPDKWINFTNDELVLLVMGAVYCIIYGVLI